jgi:hypothetical protein
MSYVKCVTNSKLDCFVTLNFLLGPSTCLILYLGITIVYCLFLTMVNFVLMSLNTFDTDCTC